MTIQMCKGRLQNVVVPEIVERATDRSHVQTFTDGISDLPAPFNSAKLWVSCRETWPHNDPDFEGLMFVSVVIQGCHRYGQLNERNVVEYIDVQPGSIFPTNPLALHWLEPKDPDIGFIALQWEVPCDEYERRLLELADGISPGAAGQKIVVKIEQALILVDPDNYIGVPPGFPSLSIGAA